MTLAEALSTRIEQLLAKNGISQYRLSMDSGVSQASISEMRKCKNRAPNLYLIAELAEGFGITLKEFFNSDVFEEVSE